MRPEDREALTIARRTRKNLEFIYAQKEKGADVEEFTQLMNSMMGMLVHLREEYLEKKEIAWEEITRVGLVPVQIEEKLLTSRSPKLKKSKAFSELIIHLRNAFSHKNYEFIGNPIVGLTLWNVPIGKNIPANRTWEADISEQELKAIAYLFMDYLEITLGQGMPEH